MNQKVMLAEIVVQSKHPEKLPDWGMGKGVIGSQEIVFKGERGRGFNSTMFAMALLDKEDELIRAAVKVRWTEKPDKPKRKRAKK